MLFKQLMPLNIYACSLVMRTLKLPGFFLLFRLIILFSGLAPNCIEDFQYLIPVIKRSFYVTPTDGKLEQAVVGRIMVTLHGMRYAALFKFAPQAHRFDLVSNRCDLVESFHKNVLATRTRV